MSKQEPETCKKSDDASFVLVLGKLSRYNNNRSMLLYCTNKNILSLLISLPSLYGQSKSSGIPMTYRFLLSPYSKILLMVSGIHYISAVGKFNYSGQVYARTTCLSFYATFRLLKNPKSSFCVPTLLFFQNERIWSRLIQNITQYFP